MEDNNWQKSYNKESNSYTITIKGLKSSNKKSEIKLEIPEELNGYPVNRIGGRAFYGYSNPESIIIPDSVESIGNLAFAYCNNLREIIFLSKTPPKIDDNIFEGCTNFILRVPSGAESDYLNELNKSNICKSQIKGIKFFGNPLKYIGNNELQVEIPEEITDITDMTFPKDSSANIEYIKIPKSVISISLEAFNNCNNLKEIEVDSYNNKYSSSDGILYNKDESTLVYYPPKKELVNFDIPFGVKTINSKAFRNCQKLNSITLPESINSIGNKAFKDCNNLKKVVIQCDNPPLLSEDAFKSDNEQLTFHVPDTSIEKYRKSAWQFLRIKPNDNNLIICLANSNKQGGKCIIGKNLKKGWIRPISKHEHGELYDVGHINVLGLLRIPGLKKQKNYKDLFLSTNWDELSEEQKKQKNKLIEELKKHPYQTEDYYSSDPKYWKQIPPEWVKWENGSLKFKYTGIDTIFNLDDFCDETDSLWTNNFDGNGKNDMIKEKDAVLFKNSAFLIKIDKSTFHTAYEWGGKGKEDEADRIEFCYKDKTYSLKITDPNWDNSLFKDTYKRNDFFNKRKMELHDNNSFQYIFDEPQYICVVLGQPRNNYCYLFATSIISYGTFNERETIVYAPRKIEDQLSKNIETPKCRVPLIKKPKKEIVEEKPEPAEVKQKKKIVVVKKNSKHL